MSEQTKEYDFEKQFKEGFPVFEKLFNMKNPELKAKVKEIVSGHLNESQLDVITDGGVIKKIQDDEPTDIEFWYYNSCLSITPFGIHFKPEHGTARKLLAFDKFFQLV